MTIHTVYALRDPRDNQIRYFGQTNDLVDRCQAHERGDASSYCGNWERQLLSLGLKPIFSVLCQVESRELADELEIELIKRGRILGLRLTNMADGGNSSGRGTGWQHTEETKQKISVAAKKRQAKRCAEGWKHSKEALAKMSRASSGRIYGPPSEITRTLIGKANAKPYPALRNVYTGEVLPAGKNVAKLSRRLGIDKAGLWDVIVGNRLYHRGWVLANSSLTREDVPLGRWPSSEREEL